MRGSSSRCSVSAVNGNGAHMYLASTSSCSTRSIRAEDVSWESWWEKDRDRDRAERGSTGVEAESSFASGGEGGERWKEGVNEREWGVCADEIENKRYGRRGGRGS
jgi:hypothetical protein